ncbi:MAG: DUF2281 domain-containing protein [Candidatus Cloacimonadota bacterium]|nr:DUF2281 domain-containing protein [Candidatus Cloacimonadota bacterium]
MLTLEESIKVLPPNLKKEVFDFVQFLLCKQTKRKTQLSLDWAGKLQKYKNQFTSVELQKKALEWWIQ